MSRRYREQRTNSNYLPPLEPFPDDEEIFQPFDQHRLRDSLRLKKNHSARRKSPENPQKKPDIKPETEEEPEDPARVSKLFYLQLYSSVYNAAITEGSQEKSEKATDAKTSRAQKVLSSVTNTLLRKSKNKDNNSANQQQQQHASLKRNVSEDFERDAEGSLHESVIVETRSPPSIIAEEVPTLKMMPPNTRSNRGDSTRFSARSSHFSTNNINEGAPVAILNTRMKNLSQFSFKYRENERPITSRQQHQQNQKHNIYNHNRRNCRTCFQVSFFSVLLLAIVLVLALVLSSPQALTSHFDVVYLPDVKPAIRPSLAFCLPMPFSEEKLRDLSVSSELASFLLYTFSPYYPNPDILDKPELLKDLTRQFRTFVSRSRRRFRSNMTLESLHSVLDALVPKCSELVAGCQTGSGAILRGGNCCRLLFEDKLVYSPDGFCLVGGGKQLAQLSSDPKFPIAPRPFSIAKLTIVLNMTSRMPVDHRVVPWEPANEDIITASVIEEGKKPAFRDVRNDFVVRPGHLISVMAKKRQILRSESKLLPGSCKSKSYDSAACKSSVVQMIAEKSVNCSLISLPRIVLDRKLPFCGPLEGLALMYVLREQGSLVTVNSTMLHQFESTLTGHCPEECEQQYFEPIINSDSMIDSRTANRFGASRTQDIAVIEMRYNTEKYIETLRLKPSPLVAMERLGIVTGATSLMLLIVILVARLGKHRRRALQFHR